MGTQLTCIGLSDCGGRAFALRDGQAPAQRRPVNAGQSAVAEGGTDTHPGDPKTKAGWQEGRDSKGAAKAR